MAASPAVLLALALLAPQATVPRPGSAKPAPFYPYVVEPHDALWGHLSDGYFREPMSVFWEPVARELYVSDSKNGRVGIFDENGTPLYTFAGSNLLLEPRSLEVDAEGTIFALDSAAAELRRFSYRGEYETTLSFERPGPEGKPVHVPVSAFARATDGRWYVIDRDAGKVLAFDAERRFELELPPPPKLERFPTPSDVAVSPTGLVAVCDQRTDPAVHVYDAKGNLVAAFGGRDVALGDFTAPVALTFDDEGFLYVVDMLRHDIKIYTGSGKFLQHFGGWFSPETRGRAAGEMLYPVDVCVVPGGGPIYVAERFGQRVQVFERTVRTEAPAQR